MHLVFKHEQELNELAQQEKDVPMRGPSGRIVYYNPGYHHGDETPAGPTRHHSGEWHPGARQRIMGNPDFASWETTIGAARGPRLPVRDYTRVAMAMKGKVIRIWDASAYPASLPPNTYIPNASQLTPNNLGFNGAPPSQDVGQQALVWRVW